jgi:hypothetical protein
MKALLLIAVFTLLSGLGDALGFIYAGRVWQGDRFHGIEALKSAVAFQAGVAMYWLALRHLQAQGVVAVEVQSLFWFTATVIGIAVLSRQFIRWPLPDQAIACSLLLGIGWLLHRTSS